MGRAEELPEPEQPEQPPVVNRAAEYRRLLIASCICNGDPAASAFYAEKSRQVWRDHRRVRLTVEEQEVVLEKFDLLDKFNRAIEKDGH